LAPVAQISQAAHARGALVVVDAAQTAGSRPVDMDALGADVLCFTGHKGLMGPQGVGGLCIREGVSIRPFQVGGTGVQTYRKTQPEQYPDRLEAGTRNGHGIAGLSAALDFINAVGIEAIRQRKAALTRRFYDGVREIPGITVYGDFTGERAAIVALNVRDRDSGQVSDLLAQEYGIATRPGAHCAPRLHQALGTQGQGAVRFSFSWFNTQDEIDAALTALQEIARDET
jgi:selenocysteine lyase/cysteine desulfurase